MEVHTTGYRIGLDIGGANLKLADTLKQTRDIPFPLWQRYDELAARLTEVLRDFPPSAPLAVTMTGELADCFADAAAGVRFIADAVLAAAPQAQAIGFYRLDGTFADIATVHQHPDDFAASNWHALAQHLSQSLTASALLIDIGSTTCDVIPLEPHRVATEAGNDFERLIAEQLVYVGIGRTPVCALLEHATLLGRRVPLMNEWFATTGDCAVLLGWQSEDPHDLQTADGLPRTRAAARARLARMVGLDQRSFPWEAAEALSRQTLASVTARICRAIEAAPPHRHWILSGHGQRLLCDYKPKHVERRTDLAHTLGPQLSRVAPAHAVAQLSANLPP